ncbi:GH3 auxin-responsive promoter family protein [Luteibaculum oceani]|uniref:GH3 auxin-responsive promoter family protein n=1 Tax=Luteibaculum oceani TaxID=1294296 RepID=A0A5C6V9E5_9FLAO|nr:GH3 auxin-responsive promoter family protein [Luteibaculum oceani]TXC81767.1 GH3 auxin-responsive promoter family protein [Luteibaculum oceani]
MALNTVLAWLIKKRIHQIELFEKYPLEVQNEVMYNLTKRAANTEWGLQHGFEKIKTAADFKSAMPLQDYEAIKPFVNRLIAGEQNLLWPTEIKWFAKSSGTTQDRSKFIPVSRESLEDCHYKGGKDLLALYYNANPNSNLYDGKSLVIGGSSEINEMREDSYIGDLSSIIIKNLPFWVEFKRTPQSNVALMAEWERKIEQMAEITMQEDVTNIAGVPSWTIVLFKRILEKTGKSSIGEVWPNLELFMHGGVNFEPYREQFNDLVQLPNIKFYQSYNASEGYFGIQSRNGLDDMLLMLDYGIYFEFIEESKWTEDQPETLSLNDLEVGKNYAVVISTNGGLWRYKLGDTIKVTSTFPFKIKVSGRTKSFINAFGEELVVENSDQAVAETCQQHNCIVNEYTACPVYMKGEESGAHEWIIEFERDPENIDAFVADLDLNIRKLNSDYDAKRTGDLTLKQLKLNVVEKDTFYQWLKSKGKLGGQHKVPRLSNDRKHVEEILEFAEKNRSFVDHSRV